MVERARQQAPRTDRTSSSMDGLRPQDAIFFRKLMATRVQNIALGADPTIMDGTPQQVGDHIVSITQSPAGEHGEVRTTYSVVEPDDTPFGEYSETADEHGTKIGYTSRLHGVVDDGRFTLTFTTRNGRPASLLLSVPNPDQVLPGRRHSMPIREHDSAYVARVREAFDR